VPLPDSSTASRSGAGGCSDDTGRLRRRAG
jgi:hypothetical protein